MFSINIFEYTTSLHTRVKTIAMQHTVNNKPSY